MSHASVPADQRKLLGISDTAVSYDYLLAKIHVLCSVFS